jgi:hypothetical protein
MRGLPLKKEKRESKKKKPSLNLIWPLETTQTAQNDQIRAPVGV